MQGRIVVERPPGTGFNSPPSLDVTITDGG
jgi:hypothetical protein